MLTRTRPRQALGSSSSAHAFLRGEVAAADARPGRAFDRLLARALQLLAIDRSETGRTEGEGM